MSAWGRAKRSEAPPQEKSLNHVKALKERHNDGKEIPENSGNCY